MQPARRKLLVLSFASLAEAGARAGDGVTIGAADVILIRHATAPGVGDPANVKVGDCTTQRNLSEQGRAEARKLGEEFRRRGVHIGKVLTSQWCRTRETARLAFPKEKSHDEPAFNSWFGQVPTESESQLKIARAILNGWKGPGVLVVVTHAVNISAVAAVKTAPAQAVVMRRDAGGSMRVVGTLVP